MIGNSGGNETCFREFRAARDVMVDPGMERLVVTRFIGSEKGGRRTA